MWLIGLLYTLFFQKHSLEKIFFSTFGQVLCLSFQIEKVSDSDREKTDVEAARRQRLKAIEAARSQLAQQNTPVSSLSPPSNVTRISEDFQLKLTFSAQGRHGLGRDEAKEIHQQRKVKRRHVTLTPATTIWRHSNNYTLLLKQIKYLYNL